jgi:hypothetical protein
MKTVISAGNMEYPLVESGKNHPPKGNVQGEHQRSEYRTVTGQYSTKKMDWIGIGENVEAFHPLFCNRDKVLETNLSLGPLEVVVLQGVIGHAQI